MLRDNKGNPLYKRMYFAVIFPDRRLPFEYVAPPGKFFNQEDIDRQLDLVVAHVEESFPRFEFRMVELVPNKINFVAVDLKKKPEVNEPPPTPSEKC
jgi:hypothetical protein